MSVSGLEPEPERYAVRCWYEIARLERGQLVKRTRMTVARFHQEAEAVEHLRRARRWRWVPEEAHDWGAEPEGFSVDEVGERISAAEYVRRHMADGTGHDIAVAAVARSLSMFQPEASP